MRIPLNCNFSKSYSCVFIQSFQFFLKITVLINTFFYIHYRYLFIYIYRLSHPLLRQF